MDDVVVLADGESVRVTQELSALLQDEGEVESAGHSQQSLHVERGDCTAAGGQELKRKDDGRIIS